MSNDYIEYDFTVGEDLAVIASALFSNPLLAQIESITSEYNKYGLLALTIVTLKAGADQDAVAGWAHALGMDAGQEPNDPPLVKTVDGQIVADRDADNFRIIANTGTTADGEDWSPYSNVIVGRALARVAGALIAGPDLQIIARIEPDYSRYHDRALHIVLAGSVTRRNGGAWERALGQPVPDAPGYDEFLTGVYAAPSITLVGER